MNHPLSVRRAEASTLWLAAAALAGGAMLVNGLLFRGTGLHALRAVYRVTGAWIQPTLVGSLADLALFVGVVIGLGKLRYADVGWLRTDLRPALLATFGFWLSMQVALVVCDWWTGTPLHWHTAWRQAGVAPVVGGFLAQALGNALLEETAYRGFWLAQLAQRIPRVGNGLRLLGAAVLSSLLFALLHLPNRLWVKGLDSPERLLSDQGRLLFMGLLLAAVALITRNLFIAVGVHALANDPMPLFEATRATTLQAFLALLVMLVLAGALLRWQLHRPWSAAARE